MLRNKKTVVMMLSFLMFTNVAFCELSSKAKKAEKLVGAGKVSEAVEIYKELMSKDAQRYADLVKEGREGMAACSLIDVKNNYTAKKFEESKKSALEIVLNYKETPSAKEAGKYLVLSQLELSAVSMQAGKYDECIVQCNDVKSKLPAETEGLDKLNGMIGTSIYSQGKKELDSKNYNAAIAKFETVIKDYVQSDKLDAAKTDLADALYQTGAALEAIKDYDGALVSFNRVVKDFSDKTEIVFKTKQELSKILLAQADENIAAKKYQEALAGLEAAVAVSTEKDGLARCKYSMGACFRLTGQDEKAFVCYKEVAEKYADTSYAAKAEADLYLLYMKLENRQDALNSIKQAVMLDAANSDYLFKLAQLQHESGKNEDAQKSAAKLLGMLQSEIPRTYVNKEAVQYRLGLSYLILGKYTEAAVEFDKALTRNPNMLEAKKSLAFAQFKDKNFSGAVETYDGLIKQYSSDFDTLNEKAAKDSSAELAKKIEDLRKDIAYFHYQKGLSYEQQGDYDKAQAECRLGFEGVSTQEAADTLKRIQSAAQKKPEPAK